MFCYERECQIHLWKIGLGNLTRFDNSSSGLTESCVKSGKSHCFVLPNGPLTISSPLHHHLTFNRSPVKDFRRLFWWKVLNFKYNYLCLSVYMHFVSRLMPQFTCSLTDRPQRVNTIFQNRLTLYCWLHPWHDWTPSIKWAVTSSMSNKDPETVWSSIQRDDFCFLSDTEIV